MDANAIIDRDILFAEQYIKSRLDSNPDRHFHGVSVTNGFTHQHPHNGAHCHPDTNPPRDTIGYPYPDDPQ